MSVELDSCIGGSGACWNNYMYALLILSITYLLNLSIVHLEMLNAMLALKVFVPHWLLRHIFQCVNQEVMHILTNSRIKDIFGQLAPGTYNVWLCYFT